MTHEGRQIPLDLPVKHPYASRYFVTHSGVIEACALVESCLQSFAIKGGGEGSGLVFFVSGIAGVGKSHFIHYSWERAVTFGISEIVVFDDLKPTHGSDHDWCSRFVSEYQRVVRNGGVLFIGSSYSSAQLTEDESVRSRLDAAQEVPIRNPSDEELPPILQSIAERRNLQLSGRATDYIVRRLPRNLLCFEHLFATIDQLCLSSGEPAKLKMIRALLTPNAE